MSVELERRILRLERLCRILLVTLAFCMVVAVAAVIYSSRRTPEHIVARSISVVGPAGQNAASLEATHDGFVGLYFRDLDGLLRCALMATPSGKPTLAFFDGRTARVSVGIVDREDGEEFSLQLRDSAGAAIWQPNVTNGY